MHTIIYMDISQRLILCIFILNVPHMVPTVIAVNIQDGLDVRWINVSTMETSIRNTY